MFHARQSAALLGYRCRSLPFSLSPSRTPSALGVVISRHPFKARGEFSQFFLNIW